MNEWELTDEEIWKTIDSYMVRDWSRPLRDEQAIAKAQLEKAEPLIRQDEKQKLVEWLEAKMETAPRGFRLARLEECLQVLRREVGEEAL